jgi:glycosyltransferase involved in cell wall biosynthesis
MPVVYPGADGYDPVDGEHPVRSIAFPFYEGFHLGIPGAPDADELDADLVHAHTPFLVGLNGLRFARSTDVPLVASYHTPTAEYADYIARGPVADAVQRVAGAYERWFLNRTDAVVVPSDSARDHLRDLGIEATIEVVPNGVDTERFTPVDETERAAFRERHGLPEGPLVGYTGRHGYEKRLGDVVDAVAAMDGGVTLVFGGDGPARDDLEAQADEAGIDARFLGFLDREKLPAFYATLDVFAFPSPVETQGLVALEANACGTPVAGADSGALAETIVEGETGYRFATGDAAACADAIERTLAQRETLAGCCLARRETISVEHAVDELAEVYRELV